MAPSRVPASSAISGGVFLTIRSITKAGTTNNHGLILKASSIEFNITEVSAVPLVSILKPMIINTIIVMVIVGTVVNNIYCMCVNKSVPAIAGARFVVSLKGESLSPK